VGMILALLLTRGGGKVIRLARSGLLVPMVMTPVVVGILWRMLLNPDFGIVNYILILFGLGKQTWLSSSRHALWAIMVTDIWKWIPFTTLCFTAGFTALNPELNEAAYVDGASAWQIFWRITLPLMRPVILVTLLLRFVDSFKVLDAVYVMTYGGPGNTTDLLSFFIYRIGLGFFKVGYASSLAMLFIVFVFVITFYWIRQRQNLEQY
jgi:multiple sugar transport system permease protein